jgi:hypothetical protein
LRISFSSTRLCSLSEGLAAIGWTLAFFAFCTSRPGFLR